MNLDLERMADEHEALLKACAEAAGARHEMLRNAGVRVHWSDTTFDADDCPKVEFCRETDGQVFSVRWSLVDHDHDTQHMEVPASVLSGAMTVADWVTPEITRYRTQVADMEERQAERDRKEYERLKAKFGGEGRYME